MKKANAATANGKPRFISAGLRSVEILSQCWHLYSTVNLGHLLEKTVRDVGANVAESQCGHRNQEKRESLNGEAASIKIASQFWHPGHVFVKEPAGESSSFNIFGSRLVMYARVSRSSFSFTKAASALRSVNSLLEISPIATLTQSRASSAWTCRSWTIRSKSNAANKQNNGH
jgi:hypothetical protein